MKKNILLVLSGIFLLAFGFLAGSYLATNKFTRLLATQKQEVSEEFEYPSFGENSFYEMIFFGQNIETRGKLQPLPEGKGFLKGKFVYNNKPAQGITFNITFNDSYIKKSVTTDEDGFFIINLLPGKWLINMIECTGWTNKPAGEFILLSGDEKLTGDKPLFETYYLRGGKDILITDTIPKKEHIVIAINPRIKMIWPEKFKYKQEATIATSKIIWDPYPNADKYLITIYKANREGLNITSFSPIIYIKTGKEAMLPLNKLPHIKNPPEKEEYLASVQAFKKSGELLSDSRSVLSSFTLTDGNILVETGMLSSDLDQERINQIYSATRAMNAAEILIDEKMLDEVEILLKKSEDYDNHGKKELLMGYLFAAKGNCAEAKKYFDLALQKGQTCIPDKYRLNCK